MARPTFGSWLPLATLSTATGKKHNPRNLEKKMPNFKLTNEFLRAEAESFFEWCPFNLTRIEETLDLRDKADFDRGKLPETLLSTVQTTWLKKLETTINWRDHFDVVKESLPAKEDYDTFMNCPMGSLDKLPARILEAVRAGDDRIAKENLTTFTQSGGKSRLKTYLRIWQSRSLALNKLIIAAWGYKQKSEGGASLGPTEIDVERMMLSEAEATGSAMQVTALFSFLRGLWEKDKTILVKTNSSEVHPSATDWGPGYERRVIPNPDMSEKRLNRFLIKLGRALAATDKRRTLPDWTHMDQTTTFIAHGWCESIIVDDLRWPLLCFLSTPALAEFLTLCVPSRWQSNQDPRTLERRIARLGLMRIPTAARITKVEKKGESIYFF